MPTEKRERQREGRRTRLEAVRKVERRRRTVRTATWVVVIAAVIIGSVVLLLPGPKPPKPLTAQQKANKLAVDAGCPKAPYTPVHPKLRWTNPPAQVLDKHRTYYATVVTTEGTFKFRLNTAHAPVNSNNFAFLAEHGFYHCVIFHRVIIGFMDQTGDPTGTGRGGPGYVVPVNEFPAPVKTGDQYDVGAVAMANSCPSNDTPKQCPPSNGSQFFVVAQAQPEAGLPPKYTVIGQLTTGTAVIERINNEGTTSGTPNVIQRILSVTITST